MAKSDDQKQAEKDQKAAAEAERKARNAAIAELTQRSMWGPRNGGKGPSR